MHQHRSSAAAISDPMMAGGITDQLASASGPLTGSGSALNQLGGYYSNRADNYGQQQQDPAGYHVGGGGSHHQSRYDNHYNPGSGSRRHYSHNMQHQQQPYDPLLANDPLLARSNAADPSGARYLSQPTGALHQSLANLPSATGKYGYGAESALHPSERAYYGHDSMGLGGQQPIRAGSMPPLSGLAGDHYNTHTGGLVDDPLLMGGPTRQHVGGLVGDGLGGQFGPTGFAGNAANSTTYVQELRTRLAEIQANFVGVKRELEMATQKLGSTMHSIKTFWSPELKKERALRKEEATKYALINDQMKLMRVEVQVSQVQIEAFLFLFLI